MNSEYSKKWREANKDKQKQYVADRREKYNEHARNWRRNNPERAKEIDAKKYSAGKERNRKSKMLSGARTRAKQYGVPFNLTIDDFELPTHCPILGLELKAGKQSTRPELDRKLPDLGYIKGNVCVISGRANRLKSDATLEELVAILAYIRP